MTWPPVQQVSPALPVAIAVLRAVMVVQVVLGVLVLPVAGFLVVDDLSDRTEEWDGLVAFLGALAAGCALLVVAGGVVVLRLLRRHPVAAGAVAAGFGMLLLLPALAQGAAFGVGEASPWVLLAGVLLAAPGAAVIWASRAG